MSLLPPGVPAFPAVPDTPVTADIDGFGPICGATDVRQAMLATLQTWLPFYVPAVAARSGLTLQQPGQWSSIYDQRPLPADQRPAIWATIRNSDPTPERRPERDGTGLVRAWWLVMVNVVAYGTTWDSTADLISAYNAAVRAAVMQHRTLGGFAFDTLWLGDEYDEKEHQAKRTVGVGINHFTVGVTGVVDTDAGPSTPGGPSGPWPSVDQVDVTIDEFPPDEPITDI